MALAAARLLPGILKGDLPAGACKGQDESTGPQLSFHELSPAQSFAQNHIYAAQLRESPGKRQRG